MTSKFSKSGYWVYLLARLLAGALFVSSGYLKIMEPADAFTRSIEAYQVISGDFAAWAGYVLMWVEFVVGAWCILGLWTTLSVSMLWFLNTVFIAAISQALLRGIDLKDCGCFGETSGASQPIIKTLILDVCMSFIFFYLIRSRKKDNQLSLDALFKAP